MRGSTRQPADTERPVEQRERDAAIWALVDRQHGAISRRQLLTLGLSARQIERRIASGRLHSVWRGVYAVGRPQLGHLGRWMAATLACGGGAVLSHGSAAALWGFGKEPPGLVEVSLPAGRSSQQPGIRVHRRAALQPDDALKHESIPVTSPTLTLIDQATQLSPRSLERAVNEADKLDLVRADALHAALGDYSGQPGVAPLRTLLDPLAFRLSDSELETSFRPIARAAGLPMPETKVWINGYEVDFCWPELGIVVETDGLRYHRTAAQQRRGLERDQAHLSAGMWPLRFSHWQVKYDPKQVRKVLRHTADRAAVPR
ncbi:MAG TPA: type IV toxin-antitoxin system AbiEi family antitoxin domain-containing protein [Solirubrobacterales bacterium]|nr:type IV toxin-antitoxin system AbiEi family antitoxin domain-containing protein [Solirubrobacterales bacterium]